jgi:hypothetical protein
MKIPLGAAFSSRKLSATVTTEEEEENNLNIQKGESFENS